MRLANTPLDKYERITTFKKGKKKGQPKVVDSAGTRYRTSISVKIPHEDIGPGKKMQASGWDEGIQTAITRERVRGRTTALNQLHNSGSLDSGVLAELDNIHQLMAVSSSLLRFHTGGVTSGSNFSQASTSSHVAGSGYSTPIGSNLLGHRARTAIMQQAETRGGHSDYPSMAQLQARRLEAASVATLNIMTAPTTENTNKFPLSEARDIKAKKAAMLTTRNNAKTYLSVFRKNQPKPAFKPSSPPRE